MNAGSVPENGTAAPVVSVIGGAWLIAVAMPAILLVRSKRKA